MSDPNIITFWHPGSMWPVIYHVNPLANNQTMPAVPQQGQHARLTWNDAGSSATAGQAYDPNTSLRNPPAVNPISPPANWRWDAVPTYDAGSYYEAHHVTPTATHFYYMAMNCGPLHSCLPSFSTVISHQAQIRTEDCISSEPIKDSEPGGKLIVEAGDDIGSRYRVDAGVGEGTYGSVYKARDRQTLKIVAVKASRRSSFMREQAEKEVRILQIIQMNDPESQYRCLRIIDAFRFQGHICIATDLHAGSLMDFMEDQADECDGLMTLPLSQIRSIVRQLLASVAYLHRLHIVHADIKLDNILLCNGESYRFEYNRTMPSVTNMRVPQNPRTRNVLCMTNIRLIDFGCAALVDEEEDPQLRTAGIYWPPEALAGQPWSYPVDMWSIGCLILEMFTGEVPFGIGSSLERLGRMQRMLGPFEKDVVAGWQATQTHRVLFRPDGRVAFPRPDMTDAIIRHVLLAKPLVRIVCPTTENTLQFMLLLQQVLHLDPNSRITAEGALAHRWFQTILDCDEGVAAAELYWDTRPQPDPCNQEVSYDKVLNDPRPTPQMHASGRPVLYASP